LQKSLNSKVAIFFHPSMQKTWNSWISCASMRQFQRIKDLKNLITGYWIVVIFVHAKIDKIVQNCNFWQKVKSHYLSNLWLNFNDLWFIGIVWLRRIYSMKFTLFALIDRTVFTKVSKQLNANIFSNIHAKDMKFIY
jgi:hypothetical protein